MLELSVTDRIAVVTLNRAPVNSINDEWMARMNAILDELEGLPHCSVVHFRTALNLFSAGFDLKVAAERSARPEGAIEMGRSTAALQALYNRIESYSKITIAEIGGSALGGGLEFTLACDLRIAALESKLGLPEVKLGLLPAAGGTQRLSRLCGRATAARLILGAEVVDGTTALDLNIVHWAVAKAELADFAAETARRYAEQPPHAIQWAKKCLAAAEFPSRDGLAIEALGAEQLSASKPTRELLDAFFKRA